MEHLHQDPWFVASIDPIHKVVHVRRTATAFQDAEEADRSFGALERLLVEHDLRHFRILMDVRDAVGRNDDAFELVLKRHSARLFEPFERCVMIMRTVVGQMQAKRIQRQQGGRDIEVYLDEAEARRALGLAP